MCCITSPPNHSFIRWGGGTCPGPVQPAGCGQSRRAGPPAGVQQTATKTTAARICIRRTRMIIAVQSYAKKMSMRNFKGIIYAVVSSATFGLIPLFSIPLLQAGMASPAILFSLRR